MLFAEEVLRVAHEAGVVTRWSVEERIPTRWLIRVENGPNAVEREIVEADLAELDKDAAEARVSQVLVEMISELKG